MDYERKAMQDGFNRGGLQYWVFLLILPIEGHEH